MSGRYLVELADWLEDVGLDVVRYDGWEDRSRSSGGYAAGRPWGVMLHHTASSSEPEDDAAYMCHGSDSRPIANLLDARDGTIWVLAAGATNTNGKGGPWAWSRGTVPLDSMNTYAVGIELANNGVGEPFPRVQIDAMFTATLAILDALDLDLGDVGQHQQYAPDRKVDPATADAVEGPWQPRSCTSSGTWNLDDTLAELARRATDRPTPEEDDMAKAQLIAAHDDPAHAVFVWGDGYMYQLSAGAMTGVGVAGGRFVSDHVNLDMSVAEIQWLIASCWTGGWVGDPYTQPDAPARAQ